MALVREHLFRSRSPRFPASLVLVLDDADFDVSDTEWERTRSGDPIRLAHYRRILRAELTCPRGSNVRLGTAQMQKFDQRFVGPQVARIINLAGSRITEQGISWDFTPDYVPTRPGSVTISAVITSGGNDGTNPNDATASFSATADGLMVVGWASRGFQTTVPTFALTDTHTGNGAWSQITEGNDGANWDVRTSLFYSQTQAAGSSGTVTNTYTGGNPNRKAWVVAELAGHDTTTPVSESLTGNGTTSTTPSLSLASVAAGNLAVGVIGTMNAGDVLAGSGETEVGEATSGNSNPTDCQMESGTEATVNWTALGADINVGCAAEFAASGGAATVTPMNPIVVRQAVQRAATR